MNGTTSVAVVGCGSYGRLLAGALNAHPACDLVAVADVDHEHAAAVATDLAVSVVDVSDLIGHAVDLVVIATPNDTHGELAVRSLQAGHDVFVEKPLTISSETARQIIAVADDTTSVLSVGHVLRTMPGVMRVEAELRGGVIGQPIAGVAHRLRRLENNQNESWKWSHERSGGELLHEIHEIDLLCWLFGEVVASESFGIGTDHVELVMEFESGSRANCAIGRKHHRPAWQVTIFGDQGALHVDFLTSQCERYDDGLVVETWSLLGSPDHDRNLRDAATGPQRYGTPNAAAPAWMQHAVALEIDHLLSSRDSGRNMLAEAPARAVLAVCNAQPSPLGPESPQTDRTTNTGDSPT